MRYTARVKHISRISLLCTILVAIIVGLWIAQQQNNSKIIRLLSSSAITDQLAGIELTKNASLDVLLPLLLPIVQNQNEASTAAQNALVARAFSEQRLQELHSTAIDKQLLEAAHWWNSNPTQKTINVVATDDAIVPSINYLSWYLGFEKPPPHDKMITLPIRDRDGSVLLAVLTIEKFSTRKQVNNLISNWMLDYDLDRNRAAVLLAALIDEVPTFPHTQNNSLAALQTVCISHDYILAWRTLHYEDGTINPDMALLGMILNQEKFFPILTKSAKENRWTHPEHPIMIASRFAKTVANRIPADLLQNEETRSKWWALFACGLLLEGR